MPDIIPRIGEALLMAAGMFWDVGWSLVLGFVISGVLQVLVSRDRISELLGDDGVREIAIATAFGAASSSCSYASASICGRWWSHAARRRYVRGDNCRISSTRVG